MEDALLKAVRVPRELPGFVETAKCLRNGLPRGLMGRWSLQFAADALGMSVWLVALEALLGVRLGMCHPTQFLQQAHGL